MSKDELVVEMAIFKRKLEADLADGRPLAQDRQEILREQVELLREEVDALTDADKASVRDGVDEINGLVNRVLALRWPAVLVTQTPRAEPGPQRTVHLNLDDEPVTRRRLPLTGLVLTIVATILTLVVWARFGGWVAAGVAVVVALLAAAWYAGSERRSRVWAGTKWVGRKSRAPFGYRLVRYAAVLAVLVGVGYLAYTRIPWMKTQGDAGNAQVNALVSSQSGTTTPVAGSGNVRPIELNNQNGLAIRYVELMARASEVERLLPDEETRLVAAGLIPDSTDPRVGCKGQLGSFLVFLSYYKYDGKQFPTPPIWTARDVYDWHCLRAAIVAGSVAQRPDIWYSGAVNDRLKAIGIDIGSGAGMPNRAHDAWPASCGDPKGG